MDLMDDHDFKMDLLDLAISSQYTILFPCKLQPLYEVQGQLF